MPKKFGIPSKDGGGDRPDLETHHKGESSVPPGKIMEVSNTHRPPEPKPSDKKPRK